MNFYEIILSIGIPTIIGALIYIGRKLQILDTLQEDVRTLKKDIREIYERLQGIDLRLNKVELRLDTVETRLNRVEVHLNDIDYRFENFHKDRLAPARSPRQLNDLGKEILANSGIKEIVDAKKTFLLDLVKQKNPTNPYDAERTINTVMEELPQHFPELIPQLKDGAFKSGSDINDVLFVGSIYLRNNIFADLGFDATIFNTAKNN